VLESVIGTTGVRDPYLVRGNGEFFLMATDLRFWGRQDGDGWRTPTRWGSRSLVVWRSTDLVSWSKPWLAEVAPPEAGMAWAPEATFRADEGDYLVYWSSYLYAPEDPNHLGEAEQYGRILCARTRDFRAFSAAEVLVDRGIGDGVIDMTSVETGGRVHRFFSGASERRLFQEAGSHFFAGDFEIVRERIAVDLHDAVEAPLIFRDNRIDRWYLWVDQYSNEPQGYIALWTKDIDEPDWQPVPPDLFHLPPNTKHGVVMPLAGDEWQRLHDADLP
jgi:hypothetical protein